MNSNRDENQQDAVVLLGSVPSPASGPFLVANERHVTPS